MGALALAVLLRTLPWQEVTGREGHSALNERGQDAGILEVIPYALWICGVETPGGVSAIVATWVTQLSFSPALIGIALESDGVFLSTILAKGRFTLSVLPREGGKEIAKRVLKAGAAPVDALLASFFMTDERWPGVPSGALGALRCVVADTKPSGDHTLVIAEVIAEQRWTRGTPLHLSDTGWKYRKPGPETIPPTTKN
jgi:flavin reductase (DIM6/NTAB) family NADH-FMN oxidoreductase RutF